MKRIMCKAALTKLCFVISLLSNNCGTSAALKWDNIICDYNYYFDKHSDSCLECPLGRFGLNCIQRCTLGFYGRLCTSPCGCEGYVCHYVNGCPKGVTHTSIIFSIS
ncbi:multiple epidermal growth factor-like domains protein 10 [Saccostrea cucullata]|uniref:multiple epidermal growth factor-like domains protein 10 n=1 Tax=Saccostrea cuccullata TaxID=36930 RepID=UPI002ED57234